MDSPWTARTEGWVRLTSRIRSASGKRSRMNRRGKLGFYKEFLAERDEILRHKDVESEKVGCDVGFERALVDWIEKHRSAWREGGSGNKVSGRGFNPGKHPMERCALEGHKLEDQLRAKDFIKGPEGVAD